MESDKDNLTKQTTTLSANNKNNFNGATLPKKHGAVVEAWRPRRSRSRSTSENTSDFQQQLKRHASQATMWYTTVPQSITTHSLGSRHAPTRRSLRHSRMLVLSKNGSVSGKYLPHIIDPYKLGACLSLAHLVTGICLIGFIFVLLHWAPYLASSDVSHFSGPPQFIAAWFSFMIMTCFRYFYPGTKRKACVFPAKRWHLMWSALFMGLSSLCALAAFLVHTAHLYYLFVAIPRCSVAEVSRDEFTSPWLGSLTNLTQVEPVKCICQYNPTRLDQSLIYWGLSCIDVKRVLPFFLTTASVINFIGCFVGFWYVGLVIRSLIRSWTARSFWFTHRSPDAAKLPMIS
ncbi:hypothetical protein TCAL_00797 [Tigriopus californicus]|uniref:Uncharacterized protein n=1 Tax=Tigriopus californicus TaxID=6832 RepID=A0A553NC51_TIGCA|nr:uncharacterized protein LOC131887844 [Tigriopus californicus]TRY63023.1 hypothetical protein TCAL_00797 [Tigriopus californicus]|eukprot:TCALIF_00797-PA protein Name:"Protein of unknown function" AED:0.10 eAED:0.10 QI:292/1/0.75/1/0/0.5/4/0/344